MRRGSLGSLLLLSCLSCTLPAEYSLDSPDYVPCGSTIRPAGARKLGAYHSTVALGGPVFVDRRIRLRDVNPKDFRPLTDGWATDGRNVWCGRASPEGPALDRARHDYAGQPRRQLGTNSWQGP
jgi:hypothetical protein